MPLACRLLGVAVRTLLTAGAQCKPDLAAGFAREKIFGVGLNTEANHLPHRNNTLVHRCRCDVIGLSDSG